MKPRNPSLNLLLALVNTCLFLSPVLAQKTYKGEFKDVMVVEFSPPYHQIVIDYESEEVLLPVGEACAIINKKKKEVAADRVVPTSIVDIEYELQNGERVVIELQIDIDENGEIALEGLFEAVEGDIAFIDGYKVRLDQGVAIVGKKGNKCEAKNMVFPSFNDPLIKPGQYFLELKGKWNDQGIVVAREVEACKNTLSEADAKLREAVEQGFNPSGLSITPTPADLPFEVSLPLHGGNITIGQYSYHLLDDILVQGYVNSVGERLVPEHQKNLSGDDPNKINFRFYVIDDPIPNAFAFPNGMIFVHTGILDIMDNEAELAIVLGHEIAHVTHEHGRERYESVIGVSTILNPFTQLLSRYTRKFNIAKDIADAVQETYAALRPEGLANVFNPQPARESQSDRVGMQYALMAGYDIREAVTFWNKMKLLTNDGAFKNKLTNNFRNMLASANFSYGNPLRTLGDMGFTVLAGLFLDTVYTSHPKSKARAQALNQLILNGYKTEDLESLDKGEAAFAKYVLGVE